MWSFDDTMNEHSELSSILCQVHHSWQLCLSPIDDVIQPLPSLPALPACPRHWILYRVKLPPTSKARSHVNTVRGWCSVPVYHVILPGPCAVTVLHRIGAARPRNKLPINVRAGGRRDRAVFSAADRKSMLNTAMATSTTAFTAVNQSET